MKSRLAMMAMLVAGISLSGTGAGLAVTGLAGSDNAGVAQYGEAPTPTPAPPVETPAPPVPPVGTPVPPVITVAPVTPPAGGTLPASESGGTDECDANGDGVVSPSEANSGNCGEVAGETAETTATPETETVVKAEQGAEPAAQVAADEGDTLPFTGFAALPVLFGGIALLAGGLVLRRRSAGL